MLILLPPSEAKAAPARGRALDLDRLSHPGLTSARRDVLDALFQLCTGDPESAAAVLGLGNTQLGEVARNAALPDAATTRADRVYTGVLYDALGTATLTPTARRRATSWLAITSSLFGLVRPNDPIAPYRLSGDVTLPGLGKVAAHWRGHLDDAVREAAGQGLIVDLRSSTYAAFWRPTPDLARRVATVRVLQQVGEQRKVVSHFNKATKGSLVRALLEDGRNPRTPAALAATMSDLGWHVEVGEPGGSGTQLDVIVTEL